MRIQGSYNKMTRKTQSLKEPYVMDDKLVQYSNVENKSNEQDIG